MRILVPTIAAILSISSIVSAQQPWPSKGYGSPHPQPFMAAPRVHTNAGNPYMPTAQGPSINYYSPTNPAMTFPDPNPGGWNFNYTPINPLAPRRAGNAPPTYSSGTYGSGSVVAGPGPAWPAPVVTPEVVRKANDPNADLVRMPAEFHRPTNEKFWVTGDYSMTFIRSMRLPALVTTGPLTDTVPGALGQPGTSILFGNDALDFNMFSGARLQAGLFLDSEDRYSIEFGGFYQAPNTQRYRMSSDANGNPTFGRPFFVAATGINREGILLNSFPGLFSGSIAIDAKSQFAGFELNARYHRYGYYADRLRMDALIGFRYLRLAESLDFQDSIVPITRNQLTFQGALVNAPNSLQDQDSFQTSNNFYGPQVGARVGWEEKWVTFDGFVKLALGVTDQQVRINGFTTLVAPTGNTTVPGGVLAQNSNIGEYRRNVFGIVPEFGADFGVNVTDHVRLKLGYSFLMWSQIARPATQIDRNVNPGQIPGAPNFGATSGPSYPTFRFNNEFLWSHFLNVGLEVHY